MAMIPRLALLATSIVAIIWSCNENGIASAASPVPVPVPSADCSTVLYEMMPCVDYISIGSTNMKASKDCCSAVGDSLKVNGNCICEALKRSGSMGIQVNMTRALALPAGCGISTSLPECGFPLPPTMAPAPVPTIAAPTPVPRAPAPRTPAPTPAPRTPAPTLAPTSAAPTPARRMAPSPAPVSRPSAAPAPTPTTTISPVNPPAPAAPPPEGAPSSGSPPASAPSGDSGGPSGEDSPAPAPSAASTFTISFSNLCVPLLLTLLASFRPL